MSDETLNRRYAEALKKYDSKTTEQPSYWALNCLNVDLYDNQIEIIDSVCDLGVEYLAVLMSRGSGKTFAVALGLIKLCLDNAGFKIGIFGPKQEQASRIIREEIRSHIVIPGTPIYKEIDWLNSSNQRITFTNGSEILALSASETTQQEGYHFHCVVLDEAHQISDTTVNARIAPMLGSFETHKMIKIGISLYRQNFWESCCSPTSKFKVLRKSWNECPIFLQQGSILYKGLEYPKYIVDLMPISVKRRVFSDNPRLHYDSVLGYTELEFNTQYEMIWVHDINLVLSEDDQKRLISGTHEILESARRELKEQYFFGLDTAAGTILPGKKDLDYTVLSIWRKNPDNTKDKVQCYEWQGDILQQMDEIYQIINPLNGIFPCAFGLADYSNIAITFVEVMQKKLGLPIEGITFAQAETTVHKNYKNAMVDEFVFELQSNRVRFPALDKIERESLFHKSFNEWCVLERHKQRGINDKIEAPPKFHDDHCMADVLAVWAIDRHLSFKGAIGKATQLPDPLFGTTNIAGRMTPVPGVNVPKSKYL